MGVAIAIERDLHAEGRERREPVNDLWCEQQAVGDDVHHHADAACATRLRHALGQVIHDRQVQERLTAKERQREALWRDRVHAPLDPLGHARGGLHRHLGRGLVVFAVIALDAVVAREVALERRQDRDPELILAGAELGEEILDVPAVGLAVLDDESVLGEGGECVALAHVGRETLAAQPVRGVPIPPATRWLGVREGVHQEAPRPHPREGR